MSLFISIHYKNFDCNLRRDHRKISYERCDYESIDEKKTILGYVPKNDEKKSGRNGLSQCQCIIIEATVL